MEGEKHIGKGILNANNTLGLISKEMREKHFPGELVELDKKEIKQSYSPDDKAAYLTTIYMPDGTRIDMLLWRDALRILEGLGWDLKCSGVKLMSIGRDKPVLLEFGEEGGEMNYIIIAPKLG